MRFHIRFTLRVCVGRMYLSSIVAKKRLVPFRLWCLGECPFHTFMLLFCMLHAVIFSYGSGMGSKRDMTANSLFRLHTKNGGLRQDWMVLGREQEASDRVWSWKWKGFSAETRTRTRDGKTKSMPPLNFFMERATLLCVSLLWVKWRWRALAQAFSGCEGKRVRARPLGSRLVPHGLDHSFIVRSSGPLLPPSSPLIASGLFRCSLYTLRLGFLLLSLPHLLLSAVFLPHLAHLSLGHSFHFYFLYLPSLASPKRICIHPSPLSSFKCRHISSPNIFIGGVFFALTISSTPLSLLSSTFPTPGKFLHTTTISLFFSNAPCCEQGICLHFQQLPLLTFFLISQLPQLLRNFFFQPFFLLSHFAPTNLNHFALLFLLTSPYVFYLQFAPSSSLISFFPCTPIFPPSFLFPIFPPPFLSPIFPPFPSFFPLFPLSLFSHPPFLLSLFSLLLPN